MLSKLGCPTYISSPLSTFTTWVEVPAAFSIFKALVFFNWISPSCISNEPVNWWMSSLVSPNFVEPLKNTIEDDTKFVWNSFA